MDSIRLNKYISSSGYCSRREADKLIELGRVCINGKQCKTGRQITGEELITIDGCEISAKTQKELVYLAFNKPEGITCTTEGDVKGNIVKFINYPEKIFPIGRLDKFSQGLIFMTNDGDIVNKILRAGNAHEKEYIVGVHRAITDEFIRKMSNGLPVLGTITKKCVVTRLGRNTFKIVLTQGLNRQIRRMCEHLGYQVTILQRTRIMNVELAKLKMGTYRKLTPAEMTEIHEMISTSSKTQEASQDKNKSSRSRKTPQTKSYRMKEAANAKEQRGKKGGSRGKPSTIDKSSRSKGKPSTIDKSSRSKGKQDKNKPTRSRKRRS
jgi:23S rRNA pseudouridine2604 synthase